MKKALTSILSQRERKKFLISTFKSPLKIKALTQSLPKGEKKLHISTFKSPLPLGEG
jgi:hypothetical protein